MLLLWFILVVNVRPLSCCFFFFFFFFADLLFGLFGMALWPSVGD